MKWIPFQFFVELPESPYCSLFSCGNLCFLRSMRHTRFSFRHVGWGLLSVLAARCPALLGFPFCTFPHPSPEAHYFTFLGACQFSLFLSYRSPPLPQSRTDSGRRPHCFFRTRPFHPAFHLKFLGIPVFFPPCHRIPPPFFCSFRPPMSFRSSLYLLPRDAARAVCFFPTSWSFFPPPQIVPPPGSF